MLYYSYLYGTLTSDTGTAVSSAMFYLAGAIIAWLLTCLGHALTASLVKGGDRYGVHYNPLRNFSFSSCIGMIAFPIFGIGWTKPPIFIPSERGKTFAVAVGGPVFCFAVSYVLLIIYAFSEIAILNSVLMAAGTAGIAFSLFNLIPLPGLCGGTALAALLPEKAGSFWHRLSEYSVLFITLIAAITVRSGLNTVIIQNVIKFLTAFLTEAV